jgi:oxygen-independent coproporphyrinogen-3 oxidase
LSCGTLPVNRGIEVDRDDRIRADVIQQLMCHDGLHISDFESAHGISFKSYFENELNNLAPLVNDGLVYVDDSEIEITASGRLLMRSVAMVFDRHLQQGANNRFSKAI